MTQTGWRAKQLASWRSAPGKVRRRFAAHAEAVQVRAEQPSGLKTCSVDAGNLPSFEAGRMGRRTSSPPQLGQTPASFVVAHDSQNVHSKEQIRALVALGGRLTLQHSQVGRSWSMNTSPRPLTVQRV